MDSIFFPPGFDPSKPDDASDAELVYHAKDAEQLDRLSKAVQGVFLFRSLDSSQLLNILNALFEVGYKITDYDLSCSHVSILISVLN